MKQTGLLRGRCLGIWIDGGWQWFTMWLSRCIRTATFESLRARPISTLARSLIPVVQGFIFWLLQMDYPKRDQFFAHKFVRLLHKAAVASEIGRDAFAILIVIAHTEDAMRYRGPAKFWNSQMVETLGFSKWDQFNAARKRAIESGWLHYECHGKRQAGEYFVQIPEGYEVVSDCPIEESSPKSGYKEGYDHGYKEGCEEGIKRGAIKGQTGVRSGGKVGYKQGEPSIPSPIPSPNPVSCSEVVSQPSEPPVLSFQCTGKPGGVEWFLSSEKFNEYCESFPTLDVMAELKKSRQWLIDNPVRRKTTRGMPKFLGGWLSKAQNSGAGKTNGGTNGHAVSGWGRVCAGFKKHDLECDRAALEAFIGPELWKAVRAVGPRNIMEMTTFTKSAVQKEFEAALRGGT